MYDEKKNDHDPIVSQDELLAVRQQLADLHQERASDQQELDALRAERDCFRMIADFTYDWEYWHAPDGTLRYVSLSCERITGYRPDEFQAEPGLLERIVHPDDRERVMRHRHDQQHRRQSYELEFRIITRSSEVRWIGHACQPVYGRNGEWLGQRASNRDITEHKRTEEALRASEEAYRTLVNNFPDGVVLLFDRELRYLVAGGQQLVRAGMSPAMLEGRTLWEALPPDMAEMGAPLYQAILAGTALAEVEQRYDGYVYRTQPVSLRNEQGQIVAGMIISQDITERTQAEEALRESEARFRTLIDHLPNSAVFLVDHDLRLLVVRGQGLIEMGWNPDLLEGKTLQECLPPATYASVAPIYQAALAGTAPAELEQTWRDHTYHLHPVSLRNEYGEIVAAMLLLQDITHRKRAEAALRESEARYRAMFERNRAVKLLIDPTTGAIVDANPAASDFYGYDLETLRMMKITDINQLSPEQVHAEMQRAAQEQRTYFLFQHRLASGEVRDVEVHSSPLEVGGQELLYSIIHDITERTQAEEALRESRALLQGIIDYSPVTLYIKDKQGRYLQISQHGANTLGYTREQFLGKTDDDLFASDVHDAWHTTDQQILSTGESLEFEVSVPLADGVHRFIAIKFPIFTDHGDICAIGGIAKDITERLQMEEALRASEAKFRSIVEQSSDGISLTDEQGYMIEWSPGMELLTGLPRAAVLGQPVADILYRMLPTDHQTPALLERYRASVQAALATGEAPWLNQLIEQSTQKSDGTLWYAQQHAFAIQTSQGFLICSIVRDITERKKTVEALQRQRQFLRQVIDSNPAIIFARDRAGQFTLVNQTMADIYGTTVESLLGKTDADMHLDAAQIAQIQQEDLHVIESGSELTIPERCITDAGGQVRYVSIVKRPLFLAEGGAEQVLVVATDITARKLAELQLQRANERLVQGNERLRQRNQEVLLLNQMGDMLQGCIGVDDAYEVIAISAAKLFAGQAGAMYMHRNGTSLYDAVASWGDPPPAETVLEEQMCWALHKQQMALYSRANGGLCVHLNADQPEAALCVPLIVQGETLGILHLRSDKRMQHDSVQRWQQLADTVARQVALALTNLTLREQLQQQAIHDPLTGLYNRRYLDETLPRELQRAERAGQPVAIIMLDIDHFKRFNDTYGHDAGDTVLRTVGHFLQQHTREADIACRYGGEEFTLVLPGASLADIQQRAEKLRAGVQSLSVGHGEQALAQVTVSLGVAIFPDHGTTADRLIQAADQALYQAKRAGRNCVVVITPPIRIHTLP